MLVSTISVAAQKFEIMPHLGYRLRSTLEVGFTDDNGRYQKVGLGINNSPYFGLVANLKLNEVTQLEFFYDHQTSTISSKDDTIADEDLPQGDFNTDYLHVGFLFNMDQERVKPFAIFTTGVTRFKPEGFDNEFRYSLGIGVGIKTYVNPKFGFRVQGRLLSSYFKKKADAACRTSCLPYEGARFFSQTDVGGGVFFAF